MNERTAGMYLALAESWSKKGQSAEATACLKKVMALCPNTRHADLAQAELVKLQGKTTPAMPAGLTRP
jgi:TolA-binding protein